MEQQGLVKLIIGYAWAFAVGGLLFVLGSIGLCTALFSRHAVPSGLSMMSVVLGAVWVVIGIKWKEEYEQS